MQARVALAALGGFLVAIIGTAIGEDPPPAQPLVIVKPVPTGTKIVYKDDPVPTMPKSCLDLVAATIVYDRAAAEFYDRTGKAFAKLELIRNSIGGDPKVIDKLVKDYQAFEVETFTDPIENGKPPAQVMAEFTVSRPQMEAACARDVRAQGR